MFYLEGDENLKHKAVSGFEAVHYTSWNNFIVTSSAIDKMFEIFGPIF